MRPLNAGKYLPALLIAITLLFACKNHRKSAAKNEETTTASTVSPREKAKAEPEAAPATALQSEEQPQDQKTSRAKPSYPDSLFFRIDRTPCFGQCPVYRMDIYQSGWAVLEGRNFFDYKGTFKSRFSAAEMDEILSLAEQHGYFKFDHVYDAPVTDLPSTTTILQTEEKEQWVYNRMNSPEQLRAFERAIEALVKARQWQPHKQVDTD